MICMTMKQLLLLSIAFANAVDPKEVRHLKKKNRNSDSNGKSKEDEVDLQSCYYNLLSASLYDGILSQSDFVTFVSLQSNGVGTTTAWNTAITSFAQLSPKFVGVYNQYACGDALVACPSIEGVDVNGVYDTEDGLLARICGSMAQAVEEYSVEIGVSVDVGGKGDSADDDAEPDVSDETGEKLVGEKPVASKTGKVPNGE